MNTVSAKITTIHNEGKLAHVFLESEGIQLSTIVITSEETSTYLKPDSRVHLHFKETEVVIGTDINSPVSLQNKITGRVVTLEKGKILSKVILTTNLGEITSIITSNAIDQLQLKENDNAVAFIKTNEIMLSE